MPTDPETYTDGRWTVTREPQGSYREGYITINYGNTGSAGLMLASQCHGVPLEAVLDYYKHVARPDAPHPPAISHWPKERVRITDTRIPGPEIIANHELPAAVKAAGYGVPHRDVDGYYWSGTGKTATLVARAAWAAQR